jgi:hypothetical protein
MQKINNKMNLSFWVVHIQTVSGIDPVKLTASSERSLQHGGDVCNINNIITNPAWSLLLSSKIIEQTDGCLFRRKAPHTTQKV